MSWKKVAITAGALFAAIGLVNAAGADSGQKQCNAFTVVADPSGVIRTPSGGLLPLGSKIEDVVTGQHGKVQIVSGRTEINGKPVPVQFQLLAENSNDKHVNVTMPTLSHSGDCQIGSGAEVATEVNAELGAGAASKEHSGMLNTVANLKVLITNTVKTMSSGQHTNLQSTGYAPQNLVPQTNAPQNQPALSAR